LKRDECRDMFYKARGISALIDLLHDYVGNVQILYETCFCLWLLSFNKNVETYFQSTKVIPRLHYVLKNIQKEKVIRVILATFKNLIKRSNKFISELVQVGVPKTLMTLSKRNFEDSDITEDLKALLEALEQHINELSSFDEYRQEVLSGHLEWTPVHASEKFWKENLSKFEENNYYILRELIKILDQNHAQNLAIACHDLGQFVQFHPRGRKILTDLGAKPKIINLMEYPDDNVKKHSLACTQKLMVSNWQMIK
jgi:V-type H+-transporting ATPase subunit H